MSDDLVKMSPKGQLVVPQDIRDDENFSPGDRFIAWPVKEGVLFKKINLPKAKTEFEKLSKAIESKFKKKMVAPEDISEAVKWARKR